MQYVMLSDNFGGLNTYLSPDKVGPGGAQQALGVDVSEGSLQAVFGQDSLGNSQVVPYKTFIPIEGSTGIYFEERFCFSLYGGVYYRSLRGYTSSLEFPYLMGIEYSDNGTTWDILTIESPPPATLTAVSGGGSVAAGDYSYYLTFKNVDGYESPPSVKLDVNVPSANSQVELALPIRYTTGTTISGSEFITVANTTKLRLGMRLAANGGIPFNSKIIQIAGSTIKIDKQCTSGGSANIIDAQVWSVCIYRSGGGITTPLLVDEKSIGTTSVIDNKANTSLGGSLLTISSAALSGPIFNLTINPSGTLMCVDGSSNVIYFSLVNNAGANPGLYNPEQSFKSPTMVLCSIYALDRFVFIAPSRSFCVFLDNALGGIPVLKYFDEVDVFDLSNYVYATEYGQHVYWNTSKGIMRTDGNSVEIFTKYTFKKQENTFFINCYGAITQNDAIYFYLLDGLSNTSPFGRVIYKYSQEAGWSKLVNIPEPSSSIGADGTIATDGRGRILCMFKDPADANASTIILEAATTRPGPAIYWTGEWTGDKHSALKKFRKISALFTGSIEIEVYIDGVALPNKLSNDNQNKTTRFSWWLPPETKGRAISLKVELKNTANPAAVEELGVWVGEQRREMP